MLANQYGKINSRRNSANLDVDLAQDLQVEDLQSFLGPQFQPDRALRLINQLYKILKETFNMSYQDNKLAAEGIRKAEQQLQSDALEIRKIFRKRLFGQHQVKTGLLIQNDRGELQLFCQEFQVSVVNPDFVLKQNVEKADGKFVANYKIQNLSGEKKRFLVKNHGLAIGYEANDHLLESMEAAEGVLEGFGEATIAVE